MSNKIIDKILSEAEAEVKEVISAAEGKAAEIIAEAEKKASDEYNVKYKEAELEAKKAYDKEISGAEMKAKKIILEKKQGEIKSVIEESKAALMNLGSEEYKNVVVGMLKEIKEAQGAEIILSAADKEALKDAVSSLGMKVSEETRAIGKGFIIKNGDIEYNFVFEDIINVCKDDLESTAYEILFG